MSNYHDDPRLTAYVLGELSAAEAAEVECLLAGSADARAAVDEIRALAAELSAQLQAEPMPALTISQREAVMSEAHKPTPRREESPAGRAQHTPVVIATCLMIAAAGALIVFSGRPVPEQQDATAKRKQNGERTVSLAGNSKTLAFNVQNQVGDREKHGQPSTEGLPHDSSVTAPANQKPGNGSRQQGQGQPGPGGNRGQKNNGGAKAAGSMRTKRLHFLKDGKVAGPLFNGGNVPPHRRRSRSQLGLYKSTNGQPGFSYARGSGRFGGGGFGRRFYKQRGRWDTGGLAGQSTVFGGRLDRGYMGRQVLDEVEQLRKLSLDLRQRQVVIGRPVSGVGTVVTGSDADVQRVLERLAELKKPSASPQPDSRILVGAKKTPQPAGQAGGKDGTPAAKTDQQPGKKTEDTFQAKDVKRVREHFVKEFDRLAKQNPGRQIAILRVKDRLAGRLAAVERQVALIARQGGKVAPVEGRVIVGEVIKAEVKGLDVDGDGRADFGNEQYDPIVENKFLTPLADPLSTFSIDVDTASYSNARRFVEQGQLPPREAVRIEDFINYFSYDYPQPKSKKDPFSVTLEAGPCPWQPKHRLVMIGLKGREIPHETRPPANLVFLIDVSGSMNSAKKLPLVKLSLEMLVDQLRPKDRLAIVTYAGNARLVLPSTAGSEKERILTAIHGLNAGGSTNGASGIRMAYQQAKKGFLEKGANRVILCTDGDFNVGVSSDDELVKMITQEAKSNVFLSVFGFGTGNLKDAKLEKIANKGNGHYAYIDGFGEAKKVFVEELTGTLYTIAKDVKIQVEFNPAKVSSYRLLGYENRILAAQDFNDDKKDAGEIGAGHTVTALYEIVPATAREKPPVDALKYQKRMKVTKGNPVSQEILTVKLRYKQPDGNKSTKMEFPLKDDGKARGAHPAAPSADFDFASAVAMYGLLLRDSKYAGGANLDLVREIALGSMGKDAEGHRSDFLKLVHQTRTLVARKLGQPVPAPRAVEAGKIKSK